MGAQRLLDVRHRRRADEFPLSRDELMAYLAERDDRVAHVLLPDEPAAVPAPAGGLPRRAVSRGRAALGARDVHPLRRSTCRDDVAAEVVAPDPVRGGGTHVINSFTEPARGSLRRDLRGQAVRGRGELRPGPARAAARPSAAHAPRRRLRHRPTCRRVRGAGDRGHRGGPEQRARSTGGRASTGALASSGRDMTELDLGDARFEAITCLFDSIGYAQDNASVIAALGAGCAGTSPRRRCRARVPARARHAATRRPRCACGDGMPATTASCSGSRRPACDLARSLMEVDYELIELRADGQLLDASHERQVNRFFSVPEMEALLASAGLALRGRRRRLPNGRRRRRRHFPCPRDWRARPRPGEGRSRPSRARPHGRAAGSRFREPRGGARARARRDRPRIRRLLQVGRGTGFRPDPFEPAGTGRAPARPAHARGPGAGLRDQAGERADLVRALAGARGDRSGVVRNAPRRRTAEGCRSCSRSGISSTSSNPGFPEVSASGEWELRHVFYSRYVPRATRIAFRTMRAASSC